MKGFRFLLVLLCMFLVTGTSAAEVPRLMNYQGVLTDVEGVPTSGSQDITFRIYGGTGDEAGLLWEETHTGVEVKGGVFNVILGSVSPMPDDLFESGEIWLGVTVGSDPEIAPRTRITPVPWALRLWYTFIGGGREDDDAGPTVSLHDGRPMRFLVLLHQFVEMGTGLSCAYHVFHTSLPSR